MEVTIVHLGVTTPAVVEEVLDEGRTVVAGGETFELSRLTANFVRSGDPYYGVRLALSRDRPATSVRAAAPGGPAVP